MLKSVDVKSLNATEAVWHINTALCYFCKRQECASLYVQVHHQKGSLDMIIADNLTDVSTANLFAYES